MCNQHTFVWYNGAGVKFEWFCLYWKKFLWLHQYLNLEGENASALGLVPIYHYETINNNQNFFGKKSAEVSLQTWRFQPGIKRVGYQKNKKGQIFWCHLQFFFLRIRPSVVNLYIVGYNRHWLNIKVKIISWVINPEK